MPFSGMTEEEKEHLRELMAGHPDSAPKRFLQTLRVGDVITMVTFIFVGGMAYAAVTSQLEDLEARLSVVPTDVQQTLLQTRSDVLSSVQALSDRQEANRIERLQDIKELSSRVSKGEQERAALNQKVDNLEDLMRDVRELLRRQAQHPNSEQKDSNG